MKLKINRQHFVDIDNIEKFVIKGDIVWVYLKEGYPPILKTDCGAYLLRNKLVNLGLQLKDFKVEHEMKVVHCKKEKFDVYIGRPEIWGNPFTIGVHGTRKEVIKKYEEYIRNKPNLLSQLYKLEGKILGCWCSPNACHGDVLIKLVKEQQNA